MSGKNEFRVGIRVWANVSNGKRVLARITEMKEDKAFITWVERLPMYPMHGELERAETIAFSKGIWIELVKLESTKG